MRILILKIASASFTLATFLIASTAIPPNPCPQVLHSIPSHPRSGPSPSLNHPPSSPRRSDLLYPTAPTQNSIYLPATPPGIARAAAVASAGVQGTIHSPCSFLAPANESLSATSVASAAAPCVAPPTLPVRAMANLSARQGRRRVRSVRGEGRGVST